VADLAAVSKAALHGDGTAQGVKQEEHSQGEGEEGPGQAPEVNKQARAAKQRGKAAAAGTGNRAVKVKEEHSQGEGKEGARRSKPATGPPSAAASRKRRKN